MTHSEKLAAVRQKIIEACPELMEKTPGCRLKHGGEIYRIEPENSVYITSPFGRDSIMVCNDDGNYVTSVEDCEILGHEPRIDHVLRTLDKKIGLWQWHPVHKPVTVIESLLRDYWQLDTDLSGQSEFTIDFLYNVFYGNKNWKLC